MTRREVAAWLVAVGVGVVMGASLDGGPQAAPEGSSVDVEALDRSVDTVMDVLDDLVRRVDVLESGR